MSMSFNNASSKMWQVSNCVCRGLSVSQRMNPKWQTFSQRTISHCVRNMEKSTSAIAKHQMCLKLLNGGNHIRNFSSFLSRSGQFKPQVRILSKSNGIEFVRHMSQSSTKFRNKTTMIYICAMSAAMLGMAYAGVPLYRIFCQSTGRGGTAVVDSKATQVADMKPIEDRVLRIRFCADTASSMQWNFKPQQTEIKVLPGETALAFYSAKNPTKFPIVGVSTYNVIPFEAGAYFNKIQCFCFEEQQLNPDEQVDMPVFFYIDPEFADDPKMENVNLITLSYTFFEAKDGVSLPVPSYAQAH